MSLHPRPDELPLYQALVADVRAGLALPQKQVSPLFLYDALGTSLFDAVCRLPWYGIHRAEMELLRAHAEEIVEGLRPPLRLIELGPGAGEKLEHLVAVLAKRQPRLDVDIIDVSADALRAAQTRLVAYKKVYVHPHVGVFETGLEAALQAPSFERRLVLFLGSNLGNFTAGAAEDFLANIRRQMRPGDGMLIGVDLLKNEDEMIRAYSDPLGVTAAFNKNLLVRLNRELGADFHLNAFSHEARWDERTKRIEMHLVSRRPQRVTLPAAEMEISFEQGESIWTESSHKYTPHSLDRLMTAAGFHRRQEWIDRKAGFLNALYWLPPVTLVE